MMRFTCPFSSRHAFKMGGFVYRVIEPMRSTFWVMNSLIRREASSSTIND